MYGECIWSTMCLVLLNVVDDGGEKEEKEKKKSTMTTRKNFHCVGVVSSTKKKRGLVIYQCGIFWIASSVNTVAQTG